MLKIDITKEALPLLKSGKALKEKILAVKAENYFKRLKIFEKKHKMKTEEFIKGFKSGKLGDDEQWFEWLFLYEAYSSIIKQKKIIEDLSL